MKKYFPFIILIFCLSFACKNQKAEIDMQAERFHQLKDSLTMDLVEIHQKGQLNGFGVAIVNENGTLYEKGIGFADKGKNKAYSKNTIQNIASISKTLIGLALMKAQELDFLNLDDPVNKHLPFEVTNPYHPNDQITIKHLATHTSTIDDTDQYMENAWVLTPNQDLTNVSTYYPYQILNPADKAIPMEDFLKKTLTPEGEYYEKNEGFLKSKPGEIFEYSNIGATLAALVIEQATKMPFNKFTKKHILSPLNMDDSGWSLDEIDITKHSRLYSHQDTLLPFYTAITYPDGMLITSANDMAKYLTELIKGYSGTGTLLSRESYAELFTEQLSDINYEDREKGHEYNDEYNTGIFMGFSAFGNIGHAGGDAGVGTWMFFNKDTKIGKFIMKNTDGVDRAGELQYYAIWNKLEEYSSKMNQAQK